jgi:hypothetical protein
VELSTLKSSGNDVFKRVTGRRNFVRLGVKADIRYLETDRPRELTLRDNKILILVTDYTGLVNEE